MPKAEIISPVTDARSRREHQVHAGTSTHHGAANLDLDRRSAGNSTPFRHNRHKIRHGCTGIGERARSQFFDATHAAKRKDIASRPWPSAIVLLTAPGRKALRDNCRLSAALQQRRRRGVPVSISMRRKLCPQLASYLANQPPCLACTRQGSSDRHHLPQDGDSAPLTKKETMANDIY